MRTSEHGELMVLTAISFSPTDAKTPRGDWTVSFSWGHVHSVSGEVYGSVKEAVKVSDAIARGLMLQTDFEAIYSVLAPLADRLGTPQVEDTVPEESIAVTE